MIAADLFKLKIRVRVAEQMTLVLETARNLKTLTGER